MKYRYGPWRGRASARRFDARRAWRRSPHRPRRPIRRSSTRRARRTSSASRTSSNTRLCRNTTSPPGSRRNFVDAGKLPPVAERLPKEPLVYQDRQHARRHRRLRRRHAPRHRRPARRPGTSGAASQHGLGRHRQRHVRVPDPHRAPVRGQGRGARAPAQPRQELGMVRGRAHPDDAHRRSSTFTAIVRTHPSSAPCALPLSSEITQLCSGHVTEVPCTMPWLSGPPLCGQWSSMAKTRSSAVRNTATLPSGVSIQRAPRRGISVMLPTAIQFIALTPPPVPCRPQPANGTHACAARRRAPTRGSTWANFCE